MSTGHNPELNRTVLPPPGRDPAVGGDRFAWVEQLPLPTVIVGGDGSILASNGAARRLMGYRAGETVGQPFWHYLLGGSKSQSLRLRRKVDGLWRQGDGRHRFLRWHVRPRFAADGGVQYAVASVADPHSMGDHVSTGEYRALWEEAPVALRLIDSDGYILRVNDAFCHLVRMRRDQLEGQAFTIIYPVERRQEMLELFRSRMARGVWDAVAERAVTLHDGRVRRLRMENAVLTDPGQNRVVVSSFSDVTPVEEPAEAAPLSGEAEQAMPAAPHTAASATTMANGARWAGWPDHLEQLRPSVVTTQAMTQLVLDSELSPSQRECLEIAEAAAGRTVEHLNLLGELAVAQLTEEAGGAVETFGLRQFIDEICEDGVDYLVDPEAPAQIMAERRALRRVLELSLAMAGSPEQAVELVVRPKGRDRLEILTHPRAGHHAGNEAVVDTVADLRWQVAKAWAGHLGGDGWAAELTPSAHGRWPVRLELAVTGGVGRSRAGENPANSKNLANSGAQLADRTGVAGAGTGTGASDVGTENNAGAGKAGGQKGETGAMVSTKQVFNAEEALSRMGGDEQLLKEVAQLFVDNAQEMMNDVRQAVARGDAAGLQISAHTLKGAASNFGADSTVEWAYQLEHMGRQNDLSGMAQALQALEAAMNDLCPALQRYVDTH